MNSASAHKTIRELIQVTSEYLDGKGVTSAKLNTERLLADVLGLSRIELFFQLFPQTVRTRLIISLCAIFDRYFHSIFRLKKLFFIIHISETGSHLRLSIATNNIYYPYT